VYDLPSLIFLPSNLFVKSSFLIECSNSSFHSQLVMGLWTGELNNINKVVIIP
jgi:hypothetical protein